MKKYFAFVLILLLFFSFNLAKAGDLNEGNLIVNNYLTPSKMTQLSVTYFNPFAETPQDTTALTREQQLALLPGYKLPKKALFFSAVMPGAGELFVGSKLKAAAFFLVEVGAWTYFGVYHSKGLKKEDEFEIFANNNWDGLKWQNWFNNYGQNLIEITGENKFTHANAMLELINAGKKTQQYYEMIGKYSEFVVGWTNVPPDRDFINYVQLQEYRDTQCPVADEYMDMRDRSNELFKIARRGITIAMLNRLFSAVDAAWTAKIHNNQLLKTSLRFEEIYYVDRMEPALSLKISW